MGSGVLALRPYQHEALKAVEGALNGGMRRPAVVMATGLGKTVVIAWLAKRRQDRPYIRAGRRVLVIAHRTELIEQAVDKIKDVAPGLSVGIVKAERNETRADVVVASVQTLQSEARRRMIADVGLIIVDEAHHAVAQSYLTVLAHYGAWGDGDPVGQDVRAVAVGFTATLGERSDGKAHGDVWQDVVFVMGVTEGVRSGYLVRPRGVRVRVDDLDLASVKQTRGDFQNGDLGRAVEESMAPEAIAKAILEHAPDDPGLIFTPTVASARVVAEAVGSAGLSVEVAWGAMDPSARRSVLDRYRAGDLDWIVNASLLTEGTDLPRAKVAVIARPTHSQTLLTQMGGRVLRPYRHPVTGVAKSEALLLFVDGRTSGYSLNAGIQLFGEESAAVKHEPTDDDELAGAELLGDLGLGEPRECDRPEVVGRNGPLVSEEVDLFGASSSAWLRTRLGIWFLPAGERLIAIVPGAAAGTWDVTAMDAKQRGTGRWVATGVHELSYAMAWAEADVTHAEKMTAARDRAWRKGKPSAAQVRYALKFGLFYADGMTSGEVSEIIAVGTASARIDPCVPGYARERVWAS